MSDATVQDRELLEQIGLKLRAAREAMGLSVEDIAARTRINAVFLRRLEDGDPEGLPGVAFIKGFVRNYKETLELEDPELDEAIQKLGPQDPFTPTQTPERPRVSVLEAEPPSGAWFKWVTVVVIAVLIAWVGYMIWSSGRGVETPTAQVTPGEPARTGESETATVPAAGSQPKPAEPAPAGTATGEESRTAAEAPPAATAPEQPPASAAEPPATAGKPEAAEPAAPAAGPASTVAPLDGRRKLKLTLRGLEATWVRLSIDRAPPIDVRLNPAETVGWEANQEIRLTVGRSDGVSVYLNGEEILLPQERDRLIPDIVLNRLTLLRLEN